MPVNTQVEKVNVETLNLIKNDPWLEPYADAINGRHKHASEKEAELTNKGKQTLSDFASGYLYFGLHRTDNGWVFREWAPNATQIFLIGTFNDWKEEKKFPVSIASLGGKVGTGKKKAVIVAFDLAYMQYSIHMGIIYCPSISSHISKIVFI